MGAITMTREMFVRLATAALRQTAGLSPEQQAEAIALHMDIVAQALGDAPAPPVQAQVVPPPLARTSFPAPNPAAVAPAPVQEPPAEPSLIVPATRIPDDAGALMKARDPEPPRAARPQARMKVEDLSQLIQERTPSSITFDVQMEDGSTRRATFVRNVVSMHAHDSVQLIYYPPNTLPTAREATEVMEVLHVDDVPIDLVAVIQGMKKKAADSLRPRRIPQSMMPSPSSGPVQHSADTYKDPALSAQTQNIFNSLG